MRNEGRRLRAVILAAVALSSPGLSAQPAPGAVEEHAGRLLAAGQWGEAAAEYEKLVAERPGDGGLRLRLGIALHGGGRYAEAARALAKAEEDGAPRPGVQVWLARARARAGQREQALAALRRAVDGGFGAVAALEREADLLALRDDPRFREVVVAADRNARPCAFAAEYRQFDFWLGEWEVRPKGSLPGTPPAESRIEKGEDDCVILESYRAPSGYSGRSLNSYDPTRRRWEQFWVDNKGRATYYVGEFREGKLHFATDRLLLPGRAAPVRGKMTFFPEGPDQVRQVIEQSSDEGRTWSVIFEGVYTRRRR